MKLIEAMKKLKDLARKCDDLKAKIQKHSADYDYETPVYPEQAKQLKEWIQSHSDTVQLIAKLRVAIQRTNINTEVEIMLGGKSVKKTIAEWIHWKRDLANMQGSMFASLTDRGLKEGTAPQSNGQVMTVKIRRYYDPKERDENLELYRSQPLLIDSTLEVINAVTELME